MNIRQLEIFLAVSRAGGFTAAADRLYMTQPAVSHAVSQLEKEAGTALFERASHGVRLTGAGAALREKAVALTALYDETERSLNCLEREAPLRLGSSITVANYLLPRLATAFAARCPDTPLTVDVRSAGEVERRLTAGETDLALTEGHVDSPLLVKRAFASFEMAAAAAPDYPGFRGEPKPEALLKAKLLLREKGSATRDTLDAAFLQRGEVLRPVWTSVNSQALLRAAEEGLGITVLPEILLRAEAEAGRLRVAHIAGMRLTNYNYVVRRADRSPTAGMAALTELALSGAGGDGTDPAFSGGITAEKGGTEWTE